jgi:hypothetical protein
MTHFRANQGLTGLLVLNNNRLGYQPERLNLEPSGAGEFIAGEVKFATLSVDDDGRPAAKAFPMGLCRQTIGTAHTLQSHTPR